MAREKLIPKPPTEDKRDPREQFTDLASKVFSVPKSEIDERETKWRHQRKKTKT